VGFTAGIAVIIFASQIKELLGLTLAAGARPDPGKAAGADLAALPTLNPATARAGRRDGRR
jgi:sulfate permease, SulP family